MTRCGVSYRQETACEGFPPRHDTTGIHHGRKLSPGDFSTPLRCARNDGTAGQHWYSWRLETVCEGFPTDMTLTGVPYRQETACEGFPPRHDTTGIHHGRKLSPGDFSTPLRCARNDGTAGQHWYSWRLETVCEGFPTDMTLTGVPYRQETVCEWFPPRHDITGIHHGRKLSLGDFSTPLRCARNDGAAGQRWYSSRQETVCEWFPTEMTPAGASYRQETVRL